MDLQSKVTVRFLKNTLDVINSKSHIIEEKIRELEGTAIETIQNETEKRILPTQSPNEKNIQIKIGISYGRTSRGHKETEKVLRK